MASVRASMDDDEMDGPVDGINITPLVDVLMVVLVMFILTATAQVAGIQVDLPKASASVSLSEPKTKAVSVNNDGQVFLDAYPVTLQELEDRLRTEKATNPDFPVVLRGDGDRFSIHGRTRPRLSNEASRIGGGIGIERIGHG